MAQERPLMLTTKKKGGMITRTGTVIGNLVQAASS